MATLSTTRKKPNLNTLEEAGQMEISGSEPVSGSDATADVEQNRERMEVGEDGDQLQTGDEEDVD